MPIKKITAYSLLIFLLFISCNDKEKDYFISSLDIFSTVWVAKFTQINGQIVESPNEILLSFPDEASFAFDLEINRCGGRIDFGTTELYDKYRRGFLYGGML